MTGIHHSLQKMQTAITITFLDRLNDQEKTIQKMKLLKMIFKRSIMSLIQEEIQKTGAIMMIFLKKKVAFLNLTLLTMLQSTQAKPDKKRSSIRNIMRSSSGYLKLEENQLMLLFQEDLMIT